MNPKILYLRLGFGLALAAFSGDCAKSVASQSDVVLKPKLCQGPLRNPLMGFIGPVDGRHEYATLSKAYVKWNEIEVSAADGPDKLVEYANAHWKGVQDHNLKIIPRVFLEWPKGSSQSSYWPIDSYWPGDLPRDFSTAQFKGRAVRMIEKMGKAWDNDPRIAFIEMGVIGPWGEQHHPSPDLETQKLLGDAFNRAFHHKLVLNRYPWAFTNYQFGIYWDSFGNPGWEMSRHVPELEGRLSDRWKIAPMAGEMAFTTDPASHAVRIATTPTEVVAEQTETLVRYIRRWHWTALGWVSNYDPRIPKAASGAARVQSAFGYRFIIEQVRYPSRVEPGKSLTFSFTVLNSGSAPFYYQWPVELSLLDPRTRQPVWRSNFKGVDIRKWLPGDFSDKGRGKPVGDKSHAGFQWETGLDYDLAAASATVIGRFKLPRNLPAGEYIIALAILDPAGNLPCVKFATANYFNGGRHPVGKIGVGIPCDHAELDASQFDDPQADHSLRYSVATGKTGGSQ